MLEKIVDGKYIWSAPATRALDENCRIETAYFKQVAQVTGAVKAAKIRISANNRYCLYVNGAAVVDGPCKGTEWYQFCDMVDIKPYLREGTNVIAVKVVAFHSRANWTATYENVGPVSVMASSYGPLLVVGGDIETNEGMVALSTGKAEWYCKVDDAIAWKNFGSATLVGALEVTDGAKLPHGWTESETIGEGFAKVVDKLVNEVSYGETNGLTLYERPIPFLIREKLAPLKPMAGTGNLVFDAAGKAVCAANQTYSIVLEAPRMTTSFVSLRCVGGAGSRVTMTYSEGFVGYDEKGEIWKKHRKDISGEVDGISDVYLPGGQDERYEPFWFRTFLLVQMEVTTGEAPLTVYMPSFVETRYPLETQITAASDASEWVKPVWDISLRTLQLCMHETYEDCPFYEQLQYTMDTRLQMLFTYAVSGDTRMARRTIHDFHTSCLPEGILQSRYPTNYRQVIPTFSLHWILMLADYYEETGDIEWIRPYRFTAERVFNWFDRHKGAYGLAEYLGRTGHWDFADWPLEWKAGVPNAVAHGPGTINNLCYAYTMLKAVPLFDKLGFPALGAYYAGEAQKILDAVMRHCWNEEKQLFREGPGFEEYSQHAQVWAVLCGLVKGDAAKRLMEKVITDKSLVQCTFVMQFYMFRALEEAGLYGETEALWNMWRSLLADGLTTVPEVPGEWTRSDCHAWGALMLYEFPRRVLGVTPLEPGYSEIQVKPMALYLQNACGDALTPQGKVHVDWAVVNGQFTMTLETPVPAQVVLPDGCMVRAGVGTHVFTAAV